MPGEGNPPVAFLRSIIGGLKGRAADGTTGRKKKVGRRTVPAWFGAGIIPGARMAGGRRFLTGLSLQ